MIRVRRSPLNTGVFALAATALASLLALLLRLFLRPDVFMPFLAAVLLSAWFHGRLGGLLSTLFSALVTFYFFLLPGFSHEDGSLNGLARLAAFVLLSILITWLTAAGRSGETLLAATLSSIEDGVIATDKHGRVTYVNPLAAELTGIAAGEAAGRPVSEVFRLAPEAGEDAIENPLGRALREVTPLHLSSQALLVSSNGTRIPIENSAAPIRDYKGRLLGGILVFRDIGGRRHLQEQLSQAQKMDAVGRLAGGVAGDFNNVLTVITGYSELMRRELPPAAPMRPFADEIMWAAERAAALTRQLLSFSRGPAAMPKHLDLNTIINGMDPMLRRQLGENVELIVLPGPALGRVKGDPAQIEQVIVNLVTNAHDAMPGGGKLVIETANVELDDLASSKKVGVKPGSYVMLAVSDTGVGMDPETRTRLFEPFFTTKQQTKGSGLGLSTVYGIVRQSDGQITVYSEPGCGTIFEIYLPRVTESAPVAAARRTVLPKGSETILLVDDEEGVRKLCNTVLQSNGYSVIEAASAASALTAYEKNSHKIDLVLTDVVMPQMNGFELGEKLGKENPEVKVLYMSGYRDNPAGVQLSGNQAFLHKPFTPDTLLEKVREVLDTSLA